MFMNHCCYQEKCNPLTDWEKIEKCGSLNDREKHVTYKAQ